MVIFQRDIDLKSGTPRPVFSLASAYYLKAECADRNYSDTMRKGIGLPVLECCYGDSNPSRERERLA